MGMKLLSLHWRERAFLQHLPILFCALLRGHEHERWAAAQKSRRLFRNFNLNYNK